MPNKDRAKLVEMFRAHQGYHPFPIAWNVKLLRGITDPSGGVHTPEWSVDSAYTRVVQGLWDSLEHRAPAEFYSEGQSSGWLVLYKFEGVVVREDFFKNANDEICRHLLDFLPLWDEEFKNPTLTVQRGIDQDYADFLAEKKEQAYWESRDVETV